MFGLNNLEGVKIVWFCFLGRCQDGLVFYLEDVEMVWFCSLGDVKIVWFAPREMSRWFGFIPWEMLRWYGLHLGRRRDDMVYITWEM